MANRRVSIGDKFGCHKGGNGFLSLPNVHVFFLSPRGDVLFYVAWGAWPIDVSLLGINLDVTKGGLGFITPNVHVFFLSPRGNVLFYVAWGAWAVSVTCGALRGAINLQVHVFLSPSGCAASRRGDSLVWERCFRRVRVSEP